MTSKYYFFYLELALKDDSDNHIYAFINVSDIPIIKLAEIFEVDLEQDPYFSNGYFLTEENFNKHKAYLSDKVGAINLEVFEYCLNMYASDDASSIIEKHKQSLLPE